MTKEYPLVMPERITAAIALAASVGVRTEILFLDEPVVRFYHPYALDWEKFVTFDNILHLEHVEERLRLLGEVRGT